MLTDFRLGRSFDKIEPMSPKYKVPSFVSRAKLIKPIILYENRIGIQDIKAKIEENFEKHQKWTIIRDIESVSLRKFLSYNSEVIEMDEFTAFSAQHVKKVIQDAMVKGTWVTLSFKETLCSISSLVRHQVVPYEILKPENFRLIFVSQKLEYPKYMLEN